MFKYIKATVSDLERIWNKDIEQNKDDERLKLNAKFKAQKIKQKKKLFNEIQEYYISVKRLIMR